MGLAGSIASGRRTDVYLSKWCRRHVVDAADTLAGCSVALLGDTTVASFRNNTHGLANESFNTAVILTDHLAQNRT